MNNEVISKIRIQKKILKVIIFLFLPYLSVYAEIIPYFSPGVSISWSKKTTVVGWKLSVGYFQDLERDKIDGYFLNVTVGKKIGIDTDLHSYWYTEIESGIATGLLFSGAGLGAAYLKNGENKIKISPKGSVFSGSVVFLRSDFLMFNNKFEYDLGGNIVLPLNKYFFSSPGVGKMNFLPSH